MSVECGRERTAEEKFSVFSSMTSLAHLVGMIYDLKSEVERQKMNQSSCDCEASVEKLVNSATLSDGEYKISLDVSAFQPEEVAVKLRARRARGRVWLCLASIHPEIAPT